MVSAAGGEFFFLGNPSGVPGKKTTKIACVDFPSKQYYYWKAAGKKERGGAPTKKAPVAQMRTKDTHRLGKPPVFEGAILRSGGAPLTQALIILWEITREGKAGRFVHL